MTDVAIREFVPADDAACRDLEARASGQAPAWTRWFMDAAMINFDVFDARVTQFELGGVALVAEVPSKTASSPEIVGTICGAVKSFLLGGREVKACYVFDLRVCPEHRKLGLGYRLSNEVERIARERFGVERLYLTVNDDNAKARALYQKCGYSFASHRAPSMKVLLGARLSRTTAPAECRLLRGQDAARAMAAGCGSRDGVPSGPCSFEALIKSPHFLGVAHCVDGDSEAGIGLWNSSALSGFYFSHLFVPAGWYFTLGGRLVLGCAGASLPAMLAALVWNAWRWHGPWSTAAAAAFSTVAGWCLVKAAPFAWFVGMLLKQSLVREEPVAKMRGRTFGAWRRGARGKELLKVALARADAELAEAGFVFRVCNLDHDHPDRVEVFGPAGFRTLFMQKDLRSGVAEEPPCWAPENFHDPRDI